MNQLLEHIFGIAKDHQRIVIDEQRIRDAGKARAQTALDDDDGFGDSAVTLAACSKPDSPRYNYLSHPVQTRARPLKVLAFTDYSTSSSGGSQALVRGSHRVPHLSLITTHSPGLRLPWWW